MAIATIVEPTPTDRALGDSLAQAETRRRRPSGSSASRCSAAKVAELWTNVLRDGTDELALAVTRATMPAQWLRWFVPRRPVGLVSVQFLLTVVIAAILYSARRGGGSVACCASAGAWRGGARRGRDRLAGQAIRGVALGVVVTALVQSVLGGIGLAVAGVPFVGAADRR